MYNIKVGLNIIANNVLKYQLLVATGTNFLTHFVMQEWYNELSIYPTCGGFKY